MIIFFANVALEMSLHKKLFFRTKLIIFAFVMVIACNTASASSKPVDLVFCYENKEFIPHFIGNSTIVPRDNPGVVIDILRELDLVERRVNIKFIRQPWARCLKALQSGSVSAVLGSYSAEREKFGVYPTVGNQIDQSRAFASATTCLLHQKSENINWDGETLKLESALTVAVPRGYSITKKLQNLGFIIYTTDSLDDAHKLLFFDRVAASISDCTFKNFPSFITMNKIPIRNHYGYLILNLSFYDENKGLSERLWNKLQKIDRKKHYQPNLLPRSDNDLSANGESGSLKK